ncbi:MAG: nitroreductase family protein [Methanomicrobiales archaeon]|nr:nitroreductase family protein [Methanomicrobiales archaeon]
MNVGTTIIKSRHSVRSFKPTPVEDHIIRDVLECARHAPTAMNHQPWLIGVVREKSLLKEIASLTDHGKFIADAALCFTIFGERDEKYYLEDCCAATENIIIALQSYGIGSCWVAGDKKPYAGAVRTLLKVPEKYTLVSLLPAGYPADIALMKKKDLDEVTFFETYEGG